MLCFRKTVRKGQEFISLSIGIWKLDVHGFGEHDLDLHESDDGDLDLHESGFDKLDLWKGRSWQRRHRYRSTRMNA